MAAAATDDRLKAEILVVFASRDVAGLALDGSVIEVDANKQFAYYGVPTTHCRYKYRSLRPSSARTWPSESGRSDPCGDFKALATWAAVPTRLVILPADAGNEFIAIVFAARSELAGAIWPCRAKYSKANQPPSCRVCSRRNGNCQVAQRRSTKTLAGRPEFRHVTNH